ncbi:hypothetical protein FF125_17775 [Aureibaculum algae]|uniref:Uncharacterized protein n=1 Tax=Aureibaculum algae TaxID=2584122 RepID=A0A5B7TZJ2_9FLAO|nr:hypothetical protein [Aureibaculum algae]QCX40207.1 hypothetical protein FF125_17775 [Aureibaculum algae]
MNREKFYNNTNLKRLARGNSNSFHSHAPQKTYVVKNYYASGFTLILISLFFLLPTLNALYKFGFDNSFFFILLLPISVLIWGFVLIIKSILLDLDPQKKIKIILTSEGLQLEKIFFTWDIIKDEEILVEGVWARYMRFFLYFKILETDRFSKYTLESHNFKLEELRYLLNVYRSRFENRVIVKSDKFEEKYQMLNKKRRDKYILKKFDF